jgi:hypothetical protein
MALEFLELLEHEAQRASIGLDPLPDESAWSQCRALCFRQSSARLGHALARATIQRLLSLLQLLPHALLARDRPGPADFAYPSFPRPSSVPSVL